MQLDVIMSSYLLMTPFFSQMIEILMPQKKKQVIYLKKFPVGVLLKGLIMDGCVLLTSTPECVVSPRQAIPRAQPEGSPRGETTHEGVDVNNTHPSMINPDYNMILANLTLNYQYFAY